jgi:hypothetical protein
MQPNPMAETRSYNCYTFAHIFASSYHIAGSLSYPLGKVGSEKRRPCRLLDRSLPVIHHHWAREMTCKRGDTSSLDPIWPIYGALDLTREGRGDSAAYPNLQY